MEICLIKNDTSGLGTFATGDELLVIMEKALLDVDHARCLSFPFLPATWHPPLISLAKGYIPQMNTICL